MYPPWARRAALDAQLLAQLHVDPDEIFLHNKKTCALNEVFGHAGAAPAPALARFHLCTIRGALQNRNRKHVIDLLEPRQLLRVILAAVPASTCCKLLDRSAEQAAAVVVVKCSAATLNESCLLRTRHARRDSAGRITDGATCGGVQTR